MFHTKNLNFRAAARCDLFGSLETAHIVCVGGCVYMTDKNGYLNFPEQIRILS